MAPFGGLWHPLADFARAPVFPAPFGRDTIARMTHPELALFPVVVELDVAWGDMAIVLLSIGKSFRGSRDGALLRRGAGTFEVRGVVEDRIGVTRKYLFNPDKLTRYQTYDASYGVNRLDGVVQAGLLGFQKAEEINPSIMILDVNMPILNGFEVLRRLRNDARTSGIKVLLFTASDRHGAVMRGIENTTCPPRFTRHTIPTAWSTGSAFASSRGVSSRYARIFGLMCGELLRSQRSNRQKLLLLVAGGILGLALGELLHRTGVCPGVPRHRPHRVET